MGSIADRLERDARLYVDPWGEEVGLPQLSKEYVRVRNGPSPEEVDRFLAHLSQSGYLPPYSGQLDVLHLQRRMILVAGGERAGKSHVSAQFLSTRVPYGSLFWIVADNYELARPEFGYVVDFLSSLGAIDSKRDISAPKVGKASLRTKTGQLIETKTADDVRKLAAVAPDGIIMAEAAQQPYEAYLRCIGRLAEKRGWLLMSGTFEGSLSWYADKFLEWQNDRNGEGGLSLSLPSWGNPYVYPDGRQDPEILRLEALYGRVEGLFDERCGAIPVPPVGLVFREFRPTVHMNAQVDVVHDKPIYLAVDPSAGGNPYSVLAVQFHNREIPSITSTGEFGVIDPSHVDYIDDVYVVDEIYETWQDEEMIAEAKKKDWWSLVRGGAIDHQAPDSRKRWMKLAGVTLASKKIKQLEGIRRLKSFLYYKRDDHGLVVEQPHLTIHPRVRSLPFEFGRYKRKDSVADDRTVKEEPPVDQNNHSIKALWYLLINRYGPVKGGRIAKVTRTWQKPNLHFHRNSNR